tara:strand:- start:3966 stop:4346 length:381 start_codon:yes stop_codon:yes gene_type:complete
MKLLTIKNITKGFSLIEVVVALFILSVSVMAIYTLIISTASSSYNLEQRYLAKEVADNRIALINTIEKPLRPIERSGLMEMGGKSWFWKEYIKEGINNDFYEYEILVKENGQDNFIYKIKGFVDNA